MIFAIFTLGGHRRPTGSVVVPFVCLWSLSDKDTSVQYAGYQAIVSLIKIK